MNQITRHIHSLKIPFTVKSPSGMVIKRFVYVYLIYGKAICLVDTGIAGSAKMIFDYIEKNQSLRERENDQEAGAEGTQNTRMVEKKH